MTERSEYARYVRGLASRIASDRFADSAACRDALINNTNHLLDCRGNVVAALQGSWVPDESEDPSVGWHLFYGFPEIRFPVTLLSSGRSALLVPHLRGYVAGGAGTVTFRVSVDRLRPRTPTATSESVSEVSTTSTTGADLAPDPIYIPADDIGDIESTSSPYRGSYVEYPTTDGNGNAARHRVLMVAVRVWAQSSGATRVPTLTGLTVREFIGG